MGNDAMDKDLADSRVSIVGAWKLLAFEGRQDNGEVTRPFGDRPQGSVIYTPAGRFAVQLLRAGRPRFAAPDQMKGAAAEIEAAFKGYIAYYGSYELDLAGSFVVHRVEGSL